MEQSDKLHETGCCLCGATKTVMDFAVDGDNCVKRAPACGPCFKHHGLSQIMIGQEYDRRKSLTRPAPTPEANAWGPKVGEMCEGTACTGRTVRGAFVEFVGSEAQLVTAESVTGYWYASAKSLRPAAPPSPPAAAAEAGKGECRHGAATVTGHCARCGKDVAPSVRKSDPYVGTLNEAAIETKTALINAHYRQKVAALTLDLDRPSVTRRDRLGRELVPWTGWVSTRNAK